MKVVVKPFELIYEYDEATDTVYLYDLVRRRGAHWALDGRLNCLRPVCLRACGKGEPIEVALDGVSIAIERTVIEERLMVSTGRPLSSKSVFHHAGRNKAAVLA